MYIDRKPPHNDYAEQAIIAGMMNSDTFFWRAIETLIPDNFYNTHFKKCFDEMSKTKTHDFVLLEQCLNGSNFNAIDLFDTNYSVTGETEFELVLDVYKRREGITSCFAAINGYLSHDRDVSSTEISNTVISRLSELNLSNKNKTQFIGELLPAEFERMEKVSKGGTAAFVTTGLTDIDRNLCIEQTDYIIIGARTSNCKSTFAAQISRNLTINQKKCVLYFLLDTSKGSETSKNLFAYAGVNLEQFNVGVITKSHLPKLSQAAVQLSEAKLAFDSSRKITTDIIYSKCQNLKAKVGKIDAVFIDYMQNIHSKSGTIRERVMQVSEDLRHMPKDIGCPFFVLSQISRYVGEEYNPPTLKNLKESGDIEEDADKILLLWYPDKYPVKRSEEDKERYRSLLQVNVEKNRNGSTGTINLSIDAPTFNIFDRTNRNDNW